MRGVGDPYKKRGEERIAEIARRRLSVLPASGFGRSLRFESTPSQVPLTKWDLDELGELTDGSGNYYFVVGYSVVGGGDLVGP